MRTSNSSRVLRTGAPLQLAGIQQVCPAVFATGPHESRGPRYRYVPTIEPLETLMSKGWGVYEASQQRSRDHGRDPYTKHMLRLRKLEDFDQSQTIRDGVPEVVMINAHDGTAAYHLWAGYLRFICSNGMIVGNKLAGFKVIHTISHQTSMDVLDAAERVVTEKFPLMLQNIDRFKQITLKREHAYRLADKAMKLRYGDTLPPFQTHDLLQVRRPEDEEPTLWNVLNRVQESVIYGGWQTTSLGFARRSIVRGVERVSAVTKINGGLWDEAMDIAAELT